MTWLVWLGALLTLAGLVLLIMCIRSAAKLRKADKPDDELRSDMQKLVAWNFGALGLSAIGLMIVIIGLTFA